VFDDGHDVILARMYGTITFVLYLAEPAWFEQGRYDGYTANTVAAVRGLLDKPDEDFGVTALVIAEVRRRPSGLGVLWPRVRALRQA